MGVTMAGLVADLRDETSDLLRLVEPLDPAGWDTPTPAEGWAVRDQVSHLAWFDEAATRAAADPDAFRAGLPALLEKGPGFVDDLAHEHAARPPADLLAWFRAARARMLGVFEGLDARARLPWYGPDMSATSFATARLMETWAHGQDVADALGAARVPTARLRHVALIGCRALPYSFAANGLPVPEAPVRVELRLPGGEPWEWGPEDAGDVVRGEVLDFCLAVAQRRHLDDLGLEITGETARAWMGIAQAFAGPPGPGRAPLR
ncbi:TIGR03084 family metal-binding protein [Bailinhaonella thermotolerans]|uniref:TIGR03084 family protein n=1 Tax=Bailinhaonella thermotolerans TaxID=1070861 RepID=A0A3A4BHB6_9ACTN|nr:TIGR03084 family metal-binding protein [Bailinhaonella thermotolerans]RJL34182.1 TIGR03084 family protein [Bailinhaonella thermotolerans]